MPAAVHLEEHLFLARAEFVGEAGHHVLADARFAEDEHRGVGTGEPLHKAHDLFHLAAFEDGDEFAGLFAGKEGETVVELLDEFLLGGHLLLQLGQDGDVAGEGHDKAQLALVVENGIAGQDQTLPVGELLDVGGRFPGFDDLRIDDLVENPLLDERADVLAPDFPLPQAGQGFVHFVDEQGRPLRVTDEDAIREGVEDTFKMGSKRRHRSVFHRHRTRNKMIAGKLVSHASACTQERQGVCGKGTSGRRGKQKSPPGSPDGDFFRKGGAEAYFFSSVTAPRVSSTIRWMRCATPSGRLTSPMAYSRLRKSYFWVPRRW